MQDAVASEAEGKFKQLCLDAVDDLDILAP